MPLDSLTGQYIRPHDWTADKAAGRNAEAVRFDEDADDMASAIGSLSQRLDGLPLPADLTAYPQRAEIALGLAGKHPLLAYTPVNPSVIGQPGGLAPLDSAGKVPATYLPAEEAVLRVEAFNGRSGAVSLELSDVTSLGFVVGGSSAAHQHPISAVTGLQGILDGKQASLGFTPAATVHTHGIADVIGLQAALDTKLNTGGAQPGALLSASALQMETDFPIGQLLMVRDYAVDVNGDQSVFNYPLKRSTRVLYTGAVEGGVQSPHYNTISIGTAIPGTWRLCGFFPIIALGTTAMISLYQRTN